MQNVKSNKTNSVKATTVKAKPSKADSAPATDIAQAAIIDTASINEPETIDPRIAKAELIAADRKSVSAFYAKINSTASVPVKPLSAFKLAHVTAHAIPRKPSVRQAAAIVTAFAASNIELTDGATAPRVFELNDIRSAIENGALRDAISSGLITVSGDTPETSLIKLRAKAAAAITGLIGSKAIALAFNK